MADAAVPKTRTNANSVIAQYRDAAAHSSQPAGNTASSPRQEAAAADEWAQVEERVISENAKPTSAIGGSKPPEPPAQKTITYDEAWAAFFTKGDWRNQQIRKPVVERGVVSKLTTPKLKAELHDQRQFVYYFQTVAMNHSIPEHDLIVITIYRHLTNEKGYISSTGDQIQKIGFQGTDPATDLRSSGMFSLLQCLFLISTAPRLSSAWFKIASSLTHEFPFVLCSINFTAMVLSLFKNKLLHRVCNRHNSVIDVLNRVYVGLFHHFITMWNTKPERQITEWDTTRRELQEFARKNQTRLYDEGVQALASRN